jgi:hypothetical protein
MVVVLKVMTSAQALMNHNPGSAPAMYKCVAEPGADHFGDFVLAVGTPSSCDWPDLDVNLLWQSQNNLPSLRNSREIRKPMSGQSTKGHQYVGLDLLLDGQRQNPGVMAKYRRCFVEDRARFFAAADKYIP